MEKYEEYGYNIQDGKVIIPELETEIKKVAFEDCSNLASVSIPPSVTEIENWVFSDCPSLASIIVSKDNKIYDSREDCNAIIHTESNTLIYGCKNTIIPPSVTEIGEFAFSGCSGLASISPPPSVTEIGEMAFALCKSLRSITIPESVAVIGKWAFAGCGSLTELRTPQSVTNIGFSSFSACENLTKVWIPTDCYLDWNDFEHCLHVQIICY